MEVEQLSYLLVSNFNSLQIHVFKSLSFKLKYVSEAKIEGFALCLSLVNCWQAQGVLAAPLQGDPSISPDEKL